jgi:tetratricopeptide (TPR) repeat protein
VVLIALLAVAFTVWMAVETFRREGVSVWLVVILIFGPIGAAVYFFARYAEHLFARPVFETQEVTVADLRAAEADVAQAGNASTWTAYASALRGRRQLDKAIEAARKGLEHDPGHLEARYELGLALEEGGRHEEARAELEQVAAAEATFDSDRVLFVLARAQQGSGDHEAARFSLETLAARSGKPEVLFECAVVQARLGDRAAAAENLQRIIAEAKEVPQYLEPNVRPWVRKAEQALRKLKSSQTPVR